MIEETAMREQDRFESFDFAHQQAMAAIRQYLADENKEVRLLVNWLMTTDANPYGFLPEGWAGSMSSAAGFWSLCHHIWHALVDDGEINFIAVTTVLKRTFDNAIFTYPSGGPRIVFTDRSYAGFEESVLTALELDNKRQPHYPADPIQFLRHDIAFIGSVKEFIAAKDLYEIADLRRCFLGDAEDDLQLAIRHYQTNPLWRVEWIAEAEDAVKKGQYL